MSDNLKTILFWGGLFAVGWWVISGDSDRENGTRGELVESIPSQFVGEWLHYEWRYRKESVVIFPEGMFDRYEGDSNRRYPDKIYWSPEKNVLQLHGEEIPAHFRTLSIQKGQLFIQDVTREVGTTSMGPFHKDH